MTHHHGWLYVVDRDSGETLELFNDARTLDGLQLATHAGDVKGFYDILAEGICESYRWIPDCQSETQEPTPVVFGLPSAEPEAPWYDVTFPASADAYGFIIEEWTGLDSGHVTSASSTVAYAGGGSSVGPRGASGRTMSVNVLLVGRSDEGLEHLFRWLEGTLNSVCDPSASIDMLVRRFCPETIGGVWDGIGRIEQVALVGGLHWEAAPSDRGACVIRRANFTIEAQDPCIYVDHVVEAGVAAFQPSQSEVDQLAFATLTPRCADADEFATLLETAYVESNRPSVGALAPVIELTLQPSGGRVFGGPTLVQIYADVDGTGTFYCGLPLLAEFGIRAIDASEEVDALTIVYDGARRDIFEKRPSSRGLASGWGWTVPTQSGIPRFGARRCAGFHVALLPLAPGDFDVPPDINFTVSLGERISCP